MKKVLLKTANAVLRIAGVQIYRAGMDMESVLKRLARRAGEIATVVDIGASDGRWSEMSMKLFPQARFIGVDPLVEREPQLKRLRERRARFDYILCVAGEQESETVELAVTEDLDGSTVGGAGIVRKVPSYSIDEIIKVKECKGPFILKFDTHGFEVPILKEQPRLWSKRVTLSWRYTTIGMWRARCCSTKCADFSMRWDFAASIWPIPCSGPRTAVFGKWTCSSRVRMTSISAIAVFAGPEVSGEAFGVS